MFRLIAWSLLALAISVPIASAQTKPPKFGVVVGQDKRGILVAGVTAGGMADLMGLTEGDLIVDITYEPLEGKNVMKKSPTLDDMKPLFDCKSGKYKLQVERKSGVSPIEGTVTWTKAEANLPGKPLFIPEKVVPLKK